MKAIMLSIKPEWVEKILNGENTIEIRKTMPKCELPVKVYIYCTLGGKVKNKNMGVCLGEKYNNICYEYGKVVAEFTLKEVYKYGGGLNPMNVLESACMTFDELVKYQNYKPFRKPYDYLDFYAWHINDLKIYDKPKELSEFRNSAYCSNYMNNVRVTKNAVFDYVAHYEESFICRKCKYFNGDFNTCDKTVQPLTRPPQSWCYVEELGANNG